MPAAGRESALWDASLDEIWTALPYASAADGGRPEIHGDGRYLPAGPSALAVDELAVASIGSALRAGSLLQASRRGSRAPRVDLAAGHAADLVRSEAQLRLPGQQAANGFAPLSRLWPTGDGWLRTHANYPWHRAALLAATGAQTQADLHAKLMTRSAFDWERLIDAVGGVAVAVRRPDEWSASAPGAAGARQPLVRQEVIGPAPARLRRANIGGLPAAGVRVLDLTRVIAGPVATRTLGALGADVLRIDPPSKPELEFSRIDGVLAKRSSFLDAATPSGGRRLHELLERADVLVYGYRPGCSTSLEDAMLGERYPGLVTVRLSAWGEQGPWGRRRGFDSLVQAASGIAYLQADPQRNPGALPCQILDHATGYLAAASALLCLREQSVSGGTHLVRVSLAATARQLLSMPPLQLRENRTDKGDWRTQLTLAAGGTVTVVRAPGQLDGHPLVWPEPVHKYGADEPFWC